MKHNLMQLIHSNQQGSFDSFEQTQRTSSVCAFLNSPSVIIDNPLSNTRIYLDQVLIGNCAAPVAFLHIYT